MSQSLVALASHKSPSGLSLCPHTVLRNYMTLSRLLGLSGRAVQVQYSEIRQVDRRVT